MDLEKGKYRHFKGPLYEVIDVARDCETEEPFVVYRALYGERGLWLRPLSNFTEVIERDEKMMKRFEKVED